MSGSERDGTRAASITMSERGFCPLNAMPVCKSAGGSGSTSSSPAPGSKERDRKSMRMDRFLEAAMSGADQRARFMPAAFVEIMDAGGLVPKSGIERVPIERAPAARTRPHSTGT